MKNYSLKIKILALCLAFSCLCCGCGISDKSKEDMFDYLVENAYVALDCSFDEYDKIEKVDQSPVPTIITYYTYINDEGISYRFTYDLYTIKEDDVVCRALVTEDLGYEHSTTIYYFERDSLKFREIAWTNKE